VTRLGLDPNDKRVVTSTGGSPGIHGRLPAKPIGYEARPLRGRQVEEGTGKTLEVKPGLTTANGKCHHSLPASGA
jgi:hypothetical protein